MVAFLVFFIIATLAEKNRRGLFGGNVFKNPARYYDLSQAKSEVTVAFVCLVFVFFVCLFVCFFILFSEVMELEETEFLERIDLSLR